MKKITKLVLALLVIAVLSSCVTNHKVALSQNKPVEGKNGIKRPEWVIHDMSTKKMHYASGFGNGFTFEVAKEKARLNADAELALWVSKTVDAVRERYIEESTANTDTTYIDKFVISTKEAGTAVLTGVIEEDFWEDAEGGVWVLVSIPVANVKSQIDYVIQSTVADLSVLDKAASEKTIADIRKAVEEVLAE
ncbi:MAG: hypothetical protein ACI4NM_04500 [Bullifex sp.]